MKHWDDHASANANVVKVLWHERDSVSKHRLREENNEDDLSEYGLGSVRTHEQYEHYAGIDFSGRRLQRETILRLDHLQWNAADLEECADLQFMYFGL